MSDGQETTVLRRREGRIGRLTLNRPRTLNALDEGMIKSIAEALDGWRDDPAIHAVVVDAAGGRAFCAGGDVRDIRRAALKGDAEAVERFFAAEYRVNLAIARFPKPYVALVDGICMGGGVGLSIHGAVRVATEHAVFAMPETAIALFPDVGASYALPRMRGAWGTYLGLTGTRVEGVNSVRVGFATHHVTRERLPALLAAMAAEGPAVVAEFTVPPADDPLPDVSAFDAPSVPAILEQLQRDGGEWARDALKALRGVSPSSVLWSFELLRRGAGATLEQCLQTELALTRWVTRHPDFAEGVRAMLVDKDRSPRWSPERLEDVDPASIASMFD